MTDTPSMALTKTQITDAIAGQNGFTKKKSSETVETFLELIKSTIESGDDVLISGFGKICVKEKRERRGRNPATGEDMRLEPRRVVTFMCSGKLRDKINGLILWPNGSIYPAPLSYLRIMIRDILKAKRIAPKIKATILITIDCRPWAVGSNMCA